MYDVEYEGRDIERIYVFLSEFLHSLSSYASALIS